MLSVKQGGIKYHFGVFRMTRPGIELQSLGPLANTSHQANGLAIVKEYTVHIEIYSMISSF